MLTPQDDVGRQGARHRAHRTGTIRRAHGFAHRMSDCSRHLLSCSPSFWQLKPSLTYNDGLDVATPQRSSQDEAEVGYSW
jgi:hypothetical protein